ncbi:dihydrofolate reductase [Spiroplasma endosymbiont of Crioceris asparagi]|uniref:dihydrofolate reductase n=1 Tax=Spiroplasma endosymbiont of Crioceris asparagi TaxID=3066286 RepID=UPI0030D3C457
MIILIWAESKNKVIGRDNFLPWNIKAEMEHFQNVTKNKTVLMGRKTWESLKIKPLPNRENIVLSKTMKNNQAFQNLKIINNLDEIIDFKNSNQELFIIGGLSVYQSTLDLADKLIISEINQEYEGDVFAPKVDFEKFILLEEKQYDGFCVKTYLRKNKLD